jgi:hypothetical protein
LRLTEVCRWRWVQLELMAGECDAEGLLVTATGPMSLDDIARRLRVRGDRMAEQMQSLINVGLVEHTAAGYKVVNFTDRQTRKQSEKRQQWRDAQARARQPVKSLTPDWHEFDTTCTPVVHDLSDEMAEKPQEMTPVIHDVPGRVEKSREENTTAGDKPARRPSWSPAISELMHTFSQAANVKEPVLNSRSDFAAAQTLWVKPLQEIERNCNGSAAAIITKAVARMRADKLTCAFPKQVVTVALSLNAERAGFVPAPSPTPAL